MMYNNATLSFYIQLFLLHILGISQLSIMKWAESSLHFLACLKNTDAADPGGAEEILQPRLGKKFPLMSKMPFAHLWDSPERGCYSDFPGLCCFLPAGSQAVMFPGILCAVLTQQPLAEGSHPSLRLGGI